ncbi:hypothetical protein LTR10_020064 [Elasticomyces elasticus]|uniref:MSP domain-containing protein n=1 Tax=Exophiala sideris TaxID=1016849 RepID=A0ABR0IVX3_9EURO|nr:hypothetical protein LTR10_020064 [Elasticomyces elasticus]KAK5021354.1 hypothetical protein LTS07_011097 [Exophiala sideris]KAK5024302.1 hypothetical protein LTR13_010923 [Exophiala sideris]KAK5049245.1 hypothetical protein LTR69_011120 [Exophiala sideris]KAK5176557.1 hypothetical protein LTR44_010945 [Eurotiomycetes sp. CCFEE 6388]
MSTHGFSLFPTTVPKISIPNPHRKAPSLHSITLVASPESAASPNAESVVLKMEGERPPLPQLPAHLDSRRYSSPSPEDIGRAVTTSSPIDGRTPTQCDLPPALPVTYTPSLYESPKPMHSPQPSFTLGTGSATTLVQTQTLITRKSPVDPSPIVPIRSMFPTYDPSVPLTKQSYVPQRPLPARLSGLGPTGAFSREDYRSSLSMPFAASAQRTAPASILNFPSDVMSVNIGPHISTQRDLEKLWEASHGTEPDFAIKSFTLEMARTEEATFIFGSHPSMPFYTLQTYDNNEIAISKTCPRKSTLTRDVVLCPLEPSSRRQPPNDGLVAFIFPKLAAMMAINQSASLAREHNLTPTDRDDIEAQAVRRAAKQEACNLRFNARGGFYEFEHPAIGHGAMSGDFAMKSPMALSPTTIQSITGKPVLHITVSMDSPLPTISVIDPNASRRTGAAVGVGPLTPVTSGGQSIRRLSTIPLTDNAGAALATLDLTAQTLFLDANGILELMPSLFSIDCIVSAMLAVAVTDAATNPAMGAMEIWRPKPAPASRFGGTAAKRPGSMKSYAGSAFYATIAERDEAEEEAKLMRETHEKDVRGKGGVRTKDSRTWFGWKKEGEIDDNGDGEKVGSRNKKGKKPKKIVMTEFDLEKMGHYQSGDRQGEELPMVTRSALSGLVVGLKLLVWALTMMVQVLAWVLVHVSRAVTSEKF